jgi:hypothetical protein
MNLNRLSLFLGLVWRLKDSKKIPKMFRIPGRISIREAWEIASRIWK